MKLCCVKAKDGEESEFYAVQNQQKLYTMKYNTSPYYFQ